MIHDERFTPISNKHDASYLCFNPLCPQSSNRVFHSLSSHAIQCSKWIVTQSLIESNLPKKQGPIIFKIFASPIQTILQSSSLEQSMILSLSSPLQKLKQQIKIRIDAVQQEIRRQVHAYLQPMMQIRKKIRQLMFDIKEERISKNKVMLNITRIMQNYHFKQIPKKQSMSFTPIIEETKQKIFETISTLASTIFHPTYTSIPDTSLSNSLKHSLQQYLLNPSDDHQKKMFKISNLLKVPQTKVYEKNQRLISQTSFIVRCSVCSCSFSTQRRKDIMGIWKNLCLHLLAEHVEEIGYGYRFGVETSNVPTTPDQVVYKMTNYKYQALQLIYKSGRKIYNFNYNNRNRLTIDLFPKFQQSSLPFPNITLADTAQIHIVVCSIAFHLQKSLKMPKPIYIYVCNYADISYLKKMIEILMLKNVIIVDIRKNEQEDDTILYQDEGEDGQQRNWENQGKKMDVEVEIEAEEAKKEEEKEAFNN